MKVGYISPCLDSSGYAEAARNHIAALHHAGVEVSVYSISNEPGILLQNSGTEQLIESLISSDSDYQVQILHMTPQSYDMHIDIHKYNIGYAAWETNRLPEHWVQTINRLNEIWVPCTHNVEVFKNSGVSIPIFCMPHPFMPRDDNQPPKLISEAYKCRYKFYSIFQWTERKNPTDLLKAYLTEFTSEDEVVLILKTYLQSPGDAEETMFIKKQIKELRDKLYLDSPPKILLVSELLSKTQMQALHSESDCYISLHRAEGFGMPIMEAMMAGNPVITTGYGGPSDFAKEYGLLVDYRMTPVCNMPWPIYTGNMLWADPDIMSARKHMRYLYEYQESAGLLGELGKRYASNKFSWDNIGQQMKQRLEEVYENLA